MFDSRNRDTSALVAVDTETGDAQEVAADPRADVAGTMVHPVTRRPQAVAFEYDRVTWKILDDSIAADIERITDDRKGQFALTSCSMDNLKWVVEYEKDDGPKTYYLYKRDTGEMEYLFSNRPELRKSYSPQCTPPLSVRETDSTSSFTTPCRSARQPWPPTGRRNRCRRC